MEPLETWELAGRRFDLARATEADLPELVALLADDPLGASRETDDLTPYAAAYRRIAADDAHLLVVVRDESGTAVATMQCTLLPGLSRAGATRLQVEAVRVAASARGGGLGAALLDHAHAWGRSHGATLAQLTSDRSRADAHRFYVARGYEASHLGFKREL